MQRTRSQLLLIGLVLCAPILTVPNKCRAGALVPPQATLSVGNDNFDIPLALNPNTGKWGAGTFNSETQEFSGVELSSAEFSASINTEIDPDPSVNYGISVQDFGAPSAFGFVFSTPIILPGVTNTVNSSLAGALNDVNGNGISITPFPGANVQIANVGIPTTNMGVDIGPANAYGPSSPGAFYTYGAFAAGPQAGPGGTWTSLSVTVGFTLSGGGDIAVLTGLAQIVPEPSSVILFGLGGVGLFGYALRRRRSR